MTEFDGIPPHPYSILIDPRNGAGEMRAGDRVYCRSLDRVVRADEFTHDGDCYVTIAAKGQVEFSYAIVRWRDLQPMENSDANR